MRNTHTGFVAGSLVHTQAGLKPIEQIQVGDFVLSKPANGQPEYKRVSKTFEHHDKEVWLIDYRVVEPDNFRKGTKDTGYFIATANHPIWVKGISKPGEPFEPIESWLSVKDILNPEMVAYGQTVIFELANGGACKVDSGGTFIAIGNRPDAGLLMEVGGPGILSGESFTCYDFSSGKPVNNGMEFISDEDIGEINIIEAGEHAYIIEADEDTSPPALLRTVYNIEVEDNHNYYVGEHGVLVQA